MGVMTGNTGLTRVMHGGQYLRKAGWPGGIEAMTQGAKTAVAGRIRQVFERIIDMRSRRTVTNFAGNSLMMRVGLEFIYIIMAIGASGISGVYYRLFGIILDRLRAVMTELSKGGGDQDIPDNYQSRNKKDKQYTKGDKLLGDIKFSAGAIFCLHIGFKLRIIYVILYKNCL
jgi:hypothetical protein